MKTINLLKKLFLFVSIISLTACSSDDSDSDSEGQFVATIDGNQFTANGENATAVFVNGTLSIVARNLTTGEQIVFTIAEGGEGTFDLSQGGNTQNGAVYNINGESAYGTVTDDGSGELVVTDLNESGNKISGTFQFIATRDSFDSQGNIITETVTVSNGSFSNLYLATELVGGGDNSLTANVDGSAVSFDAVNAITVEFNGATTINISASNNTTNQNIGITFPSDITVGTYELGSFLAGYVASYNPNLGVGSLNYYSDPGTLVITSYNTTTNVIEGTFEFTGIAFLNQDPGVEYAVTNGVFSVVVQ